jgi:pimeloyl-ACP methyl ester carboxylesterase
MADDPMNSGGAAAFPQQPPPRHHVAVIFFHGIGQQRKYESTAALLESLDDWAFKNHRARAAGFDRPRLQIRSRSEVCRGDQSGDAVTYVQADYQKSRVRFYEGYWAPAAVMGTSAAGAMRWLMRQLVRPVGVLRTPWRSYARLRRGDLLRLSTRTSARLERTDDARALEARDTARRLVGLYRHFVAQREAERRTFKAFLQFVADDVQKEPDRPAAQQLVTMARKWHRFHLRTQLLHLGVFALVAMTGLAALALIVTGLLVVLAKASTIPVLVHLAGDDALKTDLPHALGLLSLLLGAVGVRAFLRDYVGDIQQFVTYEDAQPLYDRRQKILAMGTRTLRHVLLDPNCERVVIVGHSLGTAVALDAVLQLRASNQAANPSASAGEVMKGPLPLDRIQHFITCGSPIDKINYFFAALRSMSRSYESLIEDLRGDITSVPFSGGGRQPYVHWINFWDRGDPISGPIESVAGDVIREQRVDNVQIASYVWPDPAKSHDGYFRHRAMVGTIFGAAFTDQFSFAHCPKVHGQPTQWPWIGPGSGSMLQSLLLWLVPAAAVSIVWTALATFTRLVPARPIGMLVLVVVILLVGVQIQRRFRLHRNAL